MNAYLQSTSHTEQQLVQQLRHHGFEALCHANITLFQAHIRSNFSYADFASRTGRAKNPLALYDDLISYISLYGLAHFQRFNALLSQGLDAGIHIPHDHLKIIDYGCGQGIATLAVLEKLAEIKQVPSLIEITLIEPSSLSLQRACNWIQARAKALNINIQIHMHQNYFDCIKAVNTAQKNATCFHLYSNILDMYHNHRFNMKHLLNLGQNHAVHNFHLAVSPDFYSGNLGFDQFLRLQAPDQMIYQTRSQIEVDEYIFKYNNMRKRMTPVSASISYVKEN